MVDKLIIIAVCCLFAILVAAVWTDHIIELPLYDDDQEFP